MPAFDSLQAIQGMPSAELAAVASRLNSMGFVTDEDGLGFGSNIIEHWSTQCDKVMAQNGYAGGPLDSRGKYFVHCGAIYVLYDTLMHSDSDAMRRLENAAKQHPSL